MTSLTKNQYIGIVIALAVAGLMFFGVSFYLSNFNNSLKMANEVSSEILQEGVVGGLTAEAGDKITVNYLGTFSNGTKFDSSYDRGTPFTFTLGAQMVIAGWDQGLIGAKEGEKIRLTIPPMFAYGEGGIPDGRGGYVIPPSSTLIFEVEVVKIEKAK